RLFLAARDRDEAERSAADLRIRIGVEAHTEAFDASDFPGHEAFARDVVNALGGLDGVLLCFGNMNDEDTAHRDAGAAVAILNQNFNGAVSLLTLFANH